MNPNGLAEALAANAAREASGNASPLPGIPVMLKDNLELASVCSGAGGSEILLNHVPAADASFVQKLHAAGVVVLSKANLSELAADVTIMPPGASAGGGVTTNLHGDFSASSSSSAQRPACRWPMSARKLQGR